MAATLPLDCACFPALEYLPSGARAVEAQRENTCERNIGEGRRQAGNRKWGKRQTRHSTEKQTDNGGGRLRESHRRREESHDTPQTDAVKHSHAQPERRRQPERGGYGKQESERGKESERKTERERERKTADSAAEIRAEKTVCGGAKCAQNRCGTVCLAFLLNLEGGTFLLKH
ncbi:UNVERIFIED_CONTAM: hypothetical protein HHA_449500 [Hammondia hammondi]|eukprot:XP_008882178.1 hypothetical protein HHA_449500 [Hammondia hammondi]